MMTLNEFVSNENIKIQLADYIQNRNLPHAIIIDGIKGTGKKTLANIISEYCVCLNNRNKPCHTCKGCIKAQHHSHPDIYIIDGMASGALSIDNIRKMRSDVYIKPNEAPTKVYMIFDCDKMLPSAQNALLKILEEPPGNTIFILTVTSANMLLNTVRSRSTIFSLSPAEINAAAKYVHHIKGSDFDYCLSLSESCGGNIGMMLQKFGNSANEAKELSDSIIKAMVLSFEYPLLCLTNKISSSRDFAAEVLENMLETASEAIEISYGISSSSTAAAELARRFSKKRLISIIQKIQRARNILNTNVNLNFFSTWLSSVLKTK